MELYDLEYSRNVKMQEKGQAESDLAAAQEKVSRLKAAYKKVNRAYDRVKELQSELEGQKDTAEVWQGNKANDYSNYLSDTFKSNYTTYINRLDDIQDSINDELTKQENKVYNLNGDILGLAQAINSLWDSIKNWGNDF